MRLVNGSEAVLYNKEIKKSKNLYFFFIFFGISAKSYSSAISAA